MSTYTAHTVWTRGDQAFTDNRYSRRHEIRFDGGVTLPASSSPQVVPVPYSDPAAVDPEEAFVAALSSCHMLWFLSLAARDGWCVDHYEDAAEGVMAAGPEGKQMMTAVTLRPAVRFAGKQPTTAQHAALHHAAHDACFIANSVKSELHCHPSLLDPKEQQP
ncbi:OsmC family protein [Denitromonas sp.]|uniref:OsmC family protein n=1 Tax=Denitromonas sp. TaxID=2734609 RepID=UPI002AFDF4EF|nr:OsmC family protein [Denitromonas sp.]